MTTESRAYIGYVDSIGGHAILGWAYNSANPGERVALRILCDNRVIGELNASEYRTDLEKAGIGDGCHAFAFPVDPGLPRSAAFAVEVAGTGVRLTDTTFRQRRRAIEAFQHSRIDGLPAIPYGYSTCALAAVDVEIAERMIAIWRSLGPSGSDTFVGGGNMWEIHADELQRPFLALLAGGDARALAQYCLELPRQKITHGLLQGEEHSRNLAAAPADGLNGEAARYWDICLCFAEALGVANCECPEQGAWGRALFADPEAVRARMERALGISLMPPQVFEGLFGVRFADGILHRRDVQACYAAWRLADLASGKDAPIVEIGGGLGGAAYYARRLGLRDYTIVDLPAISLLQFYVLAKAFGQEHVAFVQRPADFRHDGRIQLVPAPLFGDPAIGGFELAFNMDSFPEMGARVAGSYLRELARKGVGRIFSINQEAAAPLTADANGERQACVRDLARESPYRQALRYPNWVRMGYVDEVLELEPRR